MQKLSRRHQLRSATAAAHTALEDVVGPIQGMPQYQRYVRGLACFRAPVEAALRSAQWPASFAAWRPTEIADALHRDISDLKLDALPAVATTLKLDGAGLLGASYVLEGSSLGAQLIAKDAARLGLTGEHGARHLAVQVASAERWKGLIALLDDPAGYELEAIAAAANETFALAHRAMAQA